MGNDKTSTEASRALSNARESKEVVLDDPIQRGETAITTLRIKKPRGGELKGINLLELAQLNSDCVATLLPRVSEPPLVKHEVENMGVSDLMACAMVLVGFLPQKAPQA